MGGGALNVRPQTTKFSEKTQDKGFTASDMATIWDTTAKAQ